MNFPPSFHIVKVLLRVLMLLSQVETRIVFALKKIHDCTEFKQTMDTYETGKKKHVTKTVKIAR